MGRKDKGENLSILITCLNVFLSVALLFLQVCAHARTNTNIVIKDINNQIMIKLSKDKNDLVARVYNYKIEYV